MTGHGWAVTDVALITVLCLGVAAAPLVARAQSPIVASPAKVLRHPTRFDGKLVRMSGRLVNITARTSRLHKRYWTFNLVDARSTIGMLSVEPLPCQGDEGATVEGVFHRLKVIDGEARYNQIDVVKITCDHRRAGTLGETRGHRSPRHI